MSFEHEGSVVFMVEKKRVQLNYKISVIDEKLTIWMEDCETLHQWKTDALAIDQFVTIDTAIPRARATDYATRFVESLSVPSDDPTYQRSLSRPAADGSRELVITLKLTVATTLEVDLNYKFKLVGLVLDNMEFLAAQLRHFQRQWEQERDATRAAMETLMNQHETLTRENVGLQNVVESLVKKWAQPVCSVLNVVDSKWQFADGFPQDGLEIDADGSTVRFDVSGVYDINANKGGVIINGQRHTYGLIKIKANHRMSIVQGVSNVSVVLIRADELSVRAGEDNSTTAVAPLSVGSASVTGMTKTNPKTV